MNKLPPSFWASLIAMMGTTVCLAVLYHHTDVNVALAVLTVGSNLVSGALGAFAGHAIGSKSDVTANNSAVTMSQTDPK
jgi:hypothetical protein